MKRINTLLKLKNRFLTKLPKNDLYLKSFISLGILSFIAAVIWIGGPHLVWGHDAPLAHADKRVYVILFLFLIWLLKFLMIDLDMPNPWQYKDPQIRKKVYALQNRFHGTVQFFKKTMVTKHGHHATLNELPWYLLIGPIGAGKTSLLANSTVNFILQRQFSAQNKQNLPSSEHCDWWVTRDISIIDVPGKYLLSSLHAKNRENKYPIYPILWNFFLRLLKKQHRKNKIHGVIMALPLPEIMQQNDTKKYHALLNDLFQRLQEIQKNFAHPISCELIITKCDLLSGFAEFFSESGNDEINQVWGIALAEPKSDEKMVDVFTHRFNSLIKRLNQQLIWRLHQERNPYARPYIKDFPLQIERLKESIQDFIKRFYAIHPDITLQGVHLTSALQTQATAQSDVLDEAINTTQRSLQIFKAPLPLSRAYFIKQLITHNLTHPRSESVPIFRTSISKMKHRITMAASLCIIACTVLVLGKDFAQGVKQTQAIQTEISQYQLTIQQFHDPDEHLIQISKLLDALQQSTKKITFQLDWSHPFSFYSQKSQIKANVMYHQALQTLLLPELKNYFQEYLKNPINRNTDAVYAVLKSYLMLGDATHFQPVFVSSTMRQILPKSMDEATAEKLQHHIHLALNTNWTPQSLDNETLVETRKFLVGMPSLKLSYIILRNIEGNNLESDIRLDSDIGSAIFITQKNKIPYMFTAKAFPNIFSTGINSAAKEAIMGNWIVGDIPEINKTPEMIAALTQQLRIAYINNYIDTWETLLNSINLSRPKDLAQTDALIIELMSDHSPLVQILQTIHENTYFEPIISSSPKLQAMGALFDKRSAKESSVYQIFSSLQLLHQYIQTVLTAQNEKKAAFELISNRVKNIATPDAITQLRLLAIHHPEPIKNWLEKIANDAWYFIMQEAGHYLDTSWQDHVLKSYQTDIANRYPFNTKTEQEVELQKFTRFFGNPGTVFNFYNAYLLPLVDTSTIHWQWKTIDNIKLPFSDNTLKQIQQAMEINQAFFPNRDNKLYVQFALQPYKFDKRIKSVKLNINDRKMVDDTNNAKGPHVFAWPNNNKSTMTSIQLTMTNQKILQRNIPGDWGWFKLVHQTFEGAFTKKQILINLYLNDQPVKYLLITQGKFNPLLAESLAEFHLSQKLTT